MKDNNHIVGVFNSEQDAVKAIDDLKNLGFSADDISVVSRNKDEMNDIHEETGTKAPEGVAAGAATGGILGGVTGLLAGIGLLAIPGIGPLLAAGPIAATLTGAAVGAGAGGLAGGLIGLGIPEEEAKEYDAYVKDRKILVMVDADEPRRARVYDIFRTYGSLNADRYTMNTTDAYTNGYDTATVADTASMASATPTATTGVTDWASDSTGAAAGTGSSLDADMQSRGATEDRDSIRLREERLDIDKERVQTGEVRVRKEVVEEQKTVNVPVQREEVVIERHAVNDRVDDGGKLGEEDTIRIPVSEERVNVTKTPVVTEEISAGKRVINDTEQVSDTLRKETAEIDREGNIIVDNASLAEKKSLADKDALSERDSVSGTTRGRR